MIFSMIFGALAMFFGRGKIGNGLNIVVIILVTYYLTTPAVYTYFEQD
jgi:hypothetical protein